MQADRRSFSIKFSLSFFTRLLLAELHTISQNVLVRYQLRIELNHGRLAKRSCVAFRCCTTTRLDLETKHLQYREAWHTPSD